MVNALSSMDDDTFEDAINHLMDAISDVIADLPAEMAKEALELDDKLLDEGRKFNDWREGH